MEQLSIKRKVGSFKCNDKCCEVRKNVLETDRFNCSTDQTTYKIYHKFDCNEKCLVCLITCNKCLKQYIGQTADIFRSQWTNYKDNSGIFDRGRLRKSTFTNIFSYQVIQVFCKIPMLLSLIRPILGHLLSMKITGFIPLRQKHLWDLMFKVVTELVLGLFSVSLYYCYICFILSIEAVFALFWFLRWSLLWQW